MHSKRILAAAALAALILVIGLWAPGPPAPTTALAAGFHPAPDTPQPDRQGGWLDSIVFTEEDSPVGAVSQLQADALDLYAYASADPFLFQAVLEDPDLALTESYGNYDDLTFNPYGPTFNDGRFNPFCSAVIREAMNRLIDRSYIAQQCFGGMATPRWVPLLRIGGDRERYRTTVEAIEAAYAHDFAQAQADITAEMTALGAYLQGGTWHYDGQEVVLIALIRIEDERREIGDYVGDQLEAIGFAVERQYKTSAQAGSCWLISDPAEGCFHVYTGGWVTTSISRDEGDNFDFFYTPRGLGLPLWQAYQPSPEFDEVSLRLSTGDFASMAERKVLFEQALGLAMNDGGVAPEGAGSVRIWLADEQGFTPRRAETIVASDLAGGVVGAQMWPYVTRFEALEGGTLRVAVPSLLLQPWNPVAGQAWLYDLMLKNATRDYGVIADPNTGLRWPQRIESAECVVKTGLPVTKTLDWVDLSFAPAIEVPDDAWADWDAATQTFITASGMPSPTLVANTQCTVTYPADLFTAVTWHDGSPLDLSDIIMRLILTFDRGKPDSAIYDESAVGNLEQFLEHFRGVQIVSTDPLVITTYDDRITLDAELLVLPWWPNYDLGPGAWHNLAAAIRAEAAGELAFSQAKADQRGVPWTDFVGGDSLPILADWMNQSAAEDYIPYEPTLGGYVTQGEADARWSALQAWYAARSHFWLGTGPFYLASVDPGVPTLTLEHFGAFPDASGRWDAFAAPPNPILLINHGSGAPGSYFNVTGTGFPPDRTGYVVVNGHLLGDLPVDGSGAIAFTLETGEADPGDYHVRVTANPSGGVGFTLDEAEPVHPREGDLPLVEVPEGLIVHPIYLPLIMSH